MKAIGLGLGVDGAVGDRGERAVAVIVIEHVVEGSGIAGRDDQVEVTVVVVVAPGTAVLLAGTLRHGCLVDQSEGAVALVVIEVVGGGCGGRANEQVEPAIVVVVAPASVPVPG